MSEDGKGMGTRERLRGTRNPNAVLTPEQVIVIRQRYAQGVTQGELCRVYGVSVGTIARIVNWHTWAWLTGDHPLAQQSPNAPHEPRLPQASDEEIAASAARLKALLGEGNSGSDPQS